MILSTIQNTRATPGNTSESELKPEKKTDPSYNRSRVLVF
jgi:hypothetical protein